MLQRMIGAALFNSATYEEIEADETALGSAVMVVLLVTVCGTIGALVNAFLAGGQIIAILFALVVGLAFGVVRWALWTTVFNIVGGKMLRTSDTQTSWSEIGRVIGFAYTPGILSILFFIPVVGPIFPAIGFLWTLAAVTVAVRQVLEFASIGRAIGVMIVAALIGFIPWAIVVALNMILIGGLVSST